MSFILVDWSVRGPLHVVVDQVPLTMEVLGQEHALVDASTQHFGSSSRHTIQVLKLECQLLVS